MKQEEKVKAYDEALEKAKEILEMTSDKSAIYTIFPELAESEDEKVRKAIIHFISHTPTVPKGIIGKETMLAWLEKQGRVKESAISQHEIETCKENDDSLTSDDEKVIDAIKHGLKCLGWEHVDGIKISDMNAWLEKQAEQKAYPKTLDEAIDLYYFSYGNNNGGFDNLSLEKFRDIVKTFVEDYGNKKA